PRIANNLGHGATAPSDDDLRFGEQEAVEPIDFAVERRQLGARAGPFSPQPFVGADQDDGRRDRKNQYTKEEREAGKLVRIEFAYRFHIGEAQYERIAVLSPGRSDNSWQGGEHSHRQCKTFPPVAQIACPGRPDRVRHALPLVCLEPAHRRPTPRIPRPALVPCEDGGTADPIDDAETT